MSTAAIRVPVARAEWPHAPLAIRLVACLALTTYGGLGWAEMVRPEAPDRMLGSAAVGAVLGAAALLATRLEGRLRGLVLASLSFLAVIAAILLAGAPVRMLDPGHWAELAAGLGSGIAALPGLNVPYRGVEEWHRTAMLLGGTLLAVHGPLLACWPGEDRRPMGPGVAAVILSVLYAVPAVQLRTDHPVLEGMVFALLLAAVLFAERLTPRDVPVALPLIVAATLVGAAIAPRLDSTRPWVDYEALAESLSERGTTAFSWDHQYGPLDWPRDGREMLRIRSSRSAYWKATTLISFDGLRWRELPARGLQEDPAAAEPDPQWVQRLRVSVRNIRTFQFVTAGTTLQIRNSPRDAVKGAPGSYVVPEGRRPLHRGHSYTARVYNPKPTAEELSFAGAEYPSSMWPYLRMDLPARVGGPVPLGYDGIADPRAPSSYVVFRDFGEGGAVGYQGRGAVEAVGDEWMRASAYARTYELAQRLAGESSSPYDYVRRVQAYLRAGFTYTETPPARPVPLDAFLFRDKVGYCQQFSGAMALLLRMGGVPARVATGFTPGTLDTRRGEYVVRDLDAHSWVEAYFPGHGWITFDPTPAVAPPRAQTAGIVEGADGGEALQEEAGAPALGERAQDPSGIDSGAAAGDGGSAPVGWYLAGGAGVLGVLGMIAVLVVGRRRLAAMTPDERVRELERALRRSRRAAGLGLTLQSLEHRMRSAPDAAAYLRALRAGRYGYGWDDSPPTRAGRIALRRELAAGLGLRGRLRALWALPPW